MAERDPRAGPGVLQAAVPQVLGRHRHGRSLRERRGRNAS